MQEIVKYKVFPYNYDFYFSILTNFFLDCIIIIIIVYFLRCGEIHNSTWQKVEVTLRINYSN